MRPIQVAGTPVEKQQALADYLETNFALSADALLYFGPKATLVRSPTMMDMYLDADLRKEMDRYCRFLRTSADAIFRLMPISCRTARRYC